MEDKAIELIRSHLNFLKKEGFQVTEPQKGAYHFESIISQGSDKLKLIVYFGKNGLKTVLQGNNELPIYKVVQKTIGISLPVEQKKIDEPKSYIGTDESGKGDYFGPLIIAGVFINNADKDELLKLGVKDSKLVTDIRINSIAAKIKSLIGNKYNIVVITPKTYNSLYESFGNLNKLLGWGHAKVLENILEKHEASEAISDKFGDEKYIVNSLQHKGRNIRLLQETKAEKYTAVAAASILARAKLNEWFEKVSKELKIKIPKGASTEVEKTAKILHEKLGPQKFSDYVKYHFKTTKRIII